MNYSASTQDFKATKSQAEVGADDVTWMTPLRTLEAIEANAATTYDKLNGKPSLFPPQNHLHPLAGFSQSGAKLGQVPTWSGTEWEPINPSFLNYENVISRPSTFLSESHTHPITSATGLKAQLDSRPNALGGLTAIQVVSELPSSPNPTTLYIVTH